MLQVLGKSSSINVRKVLWLCTELGIEYLHEEWATAERPTDVPEFLRLNPNGLVPVIRDGEFVLWESNTICRYLAAAHDRTDLLPAVPRERALVEQWMDWQATELNTAWRYVFMARVRRHPAYRDEAAAQASEQAWNRHMRLLDDRLAVTAAYAAGERFTLADIVLGLSVNRWQMTPIDRPELGAVQAYSERLLQRPGYRRHGANGLP